MSGARFALGPATAAMLADLGLPAGPLLRAAGLPGDLFQRPRAVLTAEQFYRCWTVLEEATGDPALAVTLAARPRAETFQAPLFAALCCADLYQAAERVATFKRLLGPQRLDVSAGGTGLRVTTAWPADPVPPAGLVAYELLHWVALARLATRTRVVPARACLPDPPTDPAYREYLGVPLERGPSVVVAFTALDARRPFLTGNTAVAAIFEADLRRGLAELDRDRSIAEQVHAALLELLPAGQATASDVARRLVLSGRTLQRRLAEEDTTFQAELARTRHALARSYLARPDLTVAEIAFLLGYDEPRSFYRAFHQWSGTTPQQARSALASG